MFIYNLVVLLYGLVIRLASVRKTKAKQWIAGRRAWKKRYALKVAALKPGEIIWVHCASYGEFEQGRPLIEQIKKEHPAYNILLTFFSPSGYEGVGLCDPARAREHCVRRVRRSGSSGADRDNRGDLDLWKSCRADAA